MSKTDDACTAWQGGCKEAYVAGRVDLIAALAHLDDCCPPIRCGTYGSDCVTCWTSYLEAQV